MSKSLEQNSLETCDGLDLYCEHFQCSDAKGIFIVSHGFGEHCGLYKGFAESLNNLGYGVYLYDLRGHGKSPGERGDLSSMDTLLDDLDLLVARAHDRYGESPLFLFGHNIGASIVALYSIANQPRLAGLVLSHIPFQIESSTTQRVIKPLLKVLSNINSLNRPQDFGSLGLAADELVHREPLSLVSTVEFDEGHEYLKLHSDKLNYSTLVFGPNRNKDQQLEFFDSIVSFDKEYWSNIQHPTNLRLDDKFSGWLEKSLASNRSANESRDISEQDSL